MEICRLSFCRAEEILSLDSIPFPRVETYYFCIRCVRCKSARPERTDIVQQTAWIPDLQDPASGPLVQGAPDLLIQGGVLDKRVASFCA